MVIISEQNYNSVDKGPYLTIYYLDGKMHRLDGPAIVGKYLMAWYYQGKIIDCQNQEEFEKLIRLKILW